MENECRILSGVTRILDLADNLIMNDSHQNPSDIYNYHAIDDHLSTGGQPTPSQIKMIQQNGFDAVINLALATSDNAIPNEGSLVAGYGMKYVHIPVEFSAPESRDFHFFCGVMHSLRDQSVFVHCAANMRVSAFLFLYRVLFSGVDPMEAERDLHAIWEPDEVWSQFIQQELKRE